MELTTDTGNPFYLTRKFLTIILTMNRTESSKAASDLSENNPFLWKMIFNKIGKIFFDSENIDIMEFGC